MAGGNFDINVGKVRPGVYVNTKSKKQQRPKRSSRGIAIIPLIGYDFGPDKSFIKLSSDSPDMFIHKFGRSIYADNDFMLQLREILKNAITVYAYIINPGTAASVTTDNLKMTAAYGGLRGNDIKVMSEANVSGGFDITIFMGEDAVEKYEGITTFADIISASSNHYVKFSADAPDTPMVAFAAKSLAGANAGTVTNMMVTEFLDKIEGFKWHTLAFPSTVSELQTACISKIKTLRTKVGKWVQAVLPNTVADYEGIINVTNSVVLENGTEEGKALTTAQVCAFVAGITAAASKTTSNTYMVYDGATGIVAPKSNEQAVAAIKNGEFFFSMSDEGKVVIEYDINSLHTFTKEKTSDYAKNRVMRVYDSFAEDLALTFPPNKYDNDPDSWLIMEGIGRSLLKQYEEDGAIQKVDYEKDFFVDQSRSGGDETYFNVGLQAVDAAEKLYFTISTR